MAAALSRHVGLHCVADNRSIYTIEKKNTGVFPFIGYYIFCGVQKWPADKHSLVHIWFKKIRIDKPELSVFIMIKHQFAAFLCFVMSLHSLRFMCSYQRWLSVSWSMIFSLYLNVHSMENLQQQTHHCIDFKLKFLEHWINHFSTAFCISCLKYCAGVFIFYVSDSLGWPNVLISCMLFKE